MNHRNWLISYRKNILILKDTLLFYNFLSFKRNIRNKVLSLACKKIFSRVLFSKLGREHARALSVTVIVRRNVRISQSHWIFRKVELQKLDCNWSNLMLCLSITVKESTRTFTSANFHIRSKFSSFAALFPTNKNDRRRDKTLSLSNWDRKICLIRLLLFGINDLKIRRDRATYISQIARRQFELHSHCANRR